MIGNYQEVHELKRYPKVEGTISNPTQIKWTNYTTKTKKSSLNYRANILIKSYFNSDQSIYHNYVYHNISKTVAEIVTVLNFSTFVYDL